MKRNFPSFRIAAGLVLAACGPVHTTSPAGNAVTSPASLHADKVDPVTTPVSVPGLIDGYFVDQVTPHVFVMHSYANSTIYDTGNGLVLVDTMLPGPIAAGFGLDDLPNMKATIASLAAQGLIRSTHVATILYTHWHPDHTGNTDSFRESDTQVIAARGTTERMNTQQCVEFFQACVPAWPVVFLPSYEVVGEETLSGPGDVQARYAPYSHTTTDLVVTLPKEKLVLTGDVLLQGYLAFTDVPNGGSMRGLVRSAQRVIDDIPNGYKVIPGHNQVMTKADAQAWVDAMSDATAYVAAHIAQGQALADIQTAAAAAPDAGGFSANIAALDSTLLPRASFVQWIYQDLTTRELHALLAARKLANTDTVLTQKMIDIINEASTDLDLAASTAYDTLSFQVNELENIDAHSGAAAILSDGALNAFTIYANTVSAARAAGQAGLTSDQYAAMQAQLAALPCDAQ